MRLDHLLSKETAKHYFVLCLSFLASLVIAGNGTVFVLFGCVIGGVLFVFGWNVMKDLVLFYWPVFLVGAGVDALFGLGATSFILLFLFVLAALILP